MIHTHDCYRPLYEDKEHFIILVTGGRGSGKSYGTGAFIERLTFEQAKDDMGQKKVHNVLYTRYTMVSAGISVIPEFLEKIELDGTGNFFHSTKTDIENLATGARIMFRGIRTSSGNQTAKLKSIHGITTFVVDEAEEWTSENEFETIMYSIRQKGIQNRIIIIMNPTDSNHFIYQKYIKDTHKLVDYDGFPVQISTHPNVLHIHTSYLDNKEHLSEQFLTEAAAMKENDPDRYAHIFMGRWTDVAEGAIFKKWGVVDEFPANARKVACGVDWGYTNDPSIIIRCGIIDNRLYLDEVCYKTYLLIKDLITEMRQPDVQGLKFYADSADPRLIQEIANGGVLIYPVSKGSGSIIAGIEKIKDMELFVTKRSLNLQDELRNYTWDKDKDGKFINQPIDKYNHCFTADTLIVTEEGEWPIVDIMVGDYVLTSQGFRRVERWFDNGTKEVVEYSVTLQNGAKVKLVATDNHRIKTEGGWCELRNLRVGNSIYLYQNAMQPQKISSIEARKVGARRVYDLQVEGVHEYYANGVLVHNCIDAARYYILGHILGQVLAPKKYDRSRVGIF